MQTSHLAFGKGQMPLGAGRITVPAGLRGSLRGGGGEAPRAGNHRIPDIMNPGSVIFRHFLRNPDISVYVAYTHLRHWKSWGWVAGGVLLGREGCSGLAGLSYWPKQSPGMAIFTPLRLIFLA